MGFFDMLTERKKKDDVTPVLDSTNIDVNDGDSIVINGQQNNVQFFQYERGQTDTSRIETYRNVAKAAEIDEVVTDIVNESFIFQRDKKAFNLDWYSGVDISDQLKEKIYEEFENVYQLSKFDELGSEYIQSFYIDGRIPFQKVINPNQRKRGIQDIVKLDPLNIVKVKVLPQRDRISQMIDSSQIKEFFVYSNKKINQKNYLNNIYNYNDDIVDGVKLPVDEITYVTSGLTDPMIGITISHIDKAIVPYNNLKMMEQSMVIYRVVRAPMRRAFYIDVSSMPKSRAEEYMKNMSNRFKAKLVYNSETGSWVDQRSVISMVEDYFIPRFNESKTTEIQNIEGQSSQEILDEVNYMREKLYQSLNGPKSRYTEDGNVFMFGKSDQIPRDEYRFKKFIDRLRNRFMLNFDDFLKTQLILKGIISEKDWPEVHRAYFWQFTEDNAFIEFKDAEILGNRVDTVGKMADLIEAGYYSKSYIRKKILMQTDEEIAQIDAELYKEKHQDPDVPPENYDSIVNNDEDGADDEDGDDGLTTDNTGSSVDGDDAEADSAEEEADELGIEDGANEEPKK